MNKIVLFLLLLALPQARAQQLFVIVYQGTVWIDGKEPLENRVIHGLAATSKIRFGSHSSAILYNTSQQFMSMSPTSETTLAATEIPTLLKGRKSPAKAVAGSGFIGYLYKYHDYQEKQEKIKGKRTAGVRRLNTDGDEKAGVTTRPADSALVLSETVRIQWNPETIGADDELVVTDDANGVLFSETVPVKGNVSLAVPKPGVYHWKISGPMESKSSISRSFIKPDAATTQKLLAELQLFREQIDPLDDIAKPLLLEEYYLAHNLTDN